MKKPFSPPYLDSSTKERLAYIFSVFGSVTFMRSDTRKALSIHARLSRTGVLLEMFEVFGGKIHLNRVGFGSSNLSFSWVARGLEARKIARVLKDVPSRKQPLLEILANFPNERSWGKERMEKINYSLKRQFFESGRVESWRDMVELADRRGNVTFDRTSGRLRLVVCHTNEGLLKSVQAFFKKEGFMPSCSSSEGVYLSSIDCKGERRMIWSCQRKKTVVAILLKMLSEGLTFQKRRVMSALELVNTESTEVLPAETNHYKYARLQSMGLRLAALAWSLQLQRGWRKRYAQKMKRDKGDKEEICEKHLGEVIKMRDRVKKQDMITTIRLDIRRLIKEGSKSSF